MDLKESPFWETQTAVRAKHFSTRSNWQVSKRYHQGGPAYGLKENRNRAGRGTVRGNTTSKAIYIHCTIEQTKV